MLNMRTNPPPRKYEARREGGVTFSPALRDVLIQPLNPGFNDALAVRRLGELADQAAARLRTLKARAGSPPSSLDNYKPQARKEAAETFIQPYLQPVLDTVALIRTITNEPAILQADIDKLSEPPELTGMERVEQSIVLSEVRVMLRGLSETQLVQTLHTAAEQSNWPLIFAAVTSPLPLLPAERLADIRALAAERAYPWLAVEQEELTWLADMAERLALTIEHDARAFAAAAAIENGDTRARTLRIGVYQQSGAAA